MGAGMIGTAGTDVRQHVRTSNHNPSAYGAGAIGEKSDSLALAKQFIEHFLVVRGFGLLLGWQNAQLGAIDSDLGLDIAAGGYFPQLAHQ
jgi:hypothetical protein